MGGYGSGRWGWHSKRYTVEDCRWVSADHLTREKILIHGVHHTGSWAWWNSRTGEKTASIDYEVNTLDLNAPWIALRYTLIKSGEKVDYRLWLSTTPLPREGVRWWFICPLVVGGQACGRRVGKLYLSPGGKYFGCRHCYNLTYTSCQESHKYDIVLSKIGKEMGLTPSLVKKVLFGGA